MHLPNIAEFDITHLSCSEMVRLSLEQPGTMLFVVPKSKNASAVTDLEKYDFENMGILKLLWVGFNSKKRNRLYLVPKAYASNDQPPSYSSNDQPPSYSSVMKSERVKGRDKARPTTPSKRRSSRALSIIQQLDACHSPIRSRPSSPYQQTSEAPVTSFKSIDNDLEDLAGLCANRASIIKIFFTGASGAITPPAPNLADDLERLAASLNELRQILQRAANRDCGTSRFELLEDAEKVVIGIKKWMDKMKPMFEEFKVVMFGDKDEFLLKVSAGNYVQWARKARGMEKESQATADRVFALRTIVEERLVTQTDWATSIPSVEASSKYERVASIANWDLVQIARLVELKR